MSYSPKNTVHVLNQYTVRLKLTQCCLSTTIKLKKIKNYSGFWVPMAVGQKFAPSKSYFKFQK